MGPDSAVLCASHTNVVEVFTWGQIIQGGKMEESHPLKSRCNFSMAVSHCFPFFFFLQPGTHFENASSKTIKFSEEIFFCYSLFQKGLHTNWKCSGFPGGWTWSTRAEAHGSLRYLVWHYPILFAYSSLKIRDDGTHLLGAPWIYS